ncbi:hypothetical protein O3P69_016655 [Scylla paramamosain]|uniref:Uncharacterized protein n=1 Tax=Scylla paramamosain TaxID=85552 RepID=A0AAW0SXW9_SCYPA
MGPDARPGALPLRLLRGPVMLGTGGEGKLNTGPSRVRCDVPPFGAPFVYLMKEQESFLGDEEFEARPPVLLLHDSHHHASPIPPTAHRFSLPTKPSHTRPSAMKPTHSPPSSSLPRPPLPRPPPPRPAPRPCRPKARCGDGGDDRPHLHYTTASAGVPPHT